MALTVAANPTVFPRKLPTLLFEKTSLKKKEKKESLSDSNASSPGGLEAEQGSSPEWKLTKRKVQAWMHSLAKYKKSLIREPQAG